MTDPSTPHDDVAPEDVALEGDVVDDSADDAINTESVNDGEEVAPHGGATPAGAAAGGPAPADRGDEGPFGDHPDTVLAAERLADLQRLQAEYVNYKRRVDRDRALVQERAVRDVLESLLPVLDDIQAARDHGDLAGGPFAAIADKLEGSLGRYGLERFGAKGEAFDPMRHEALMHAPWPEGDPDLPVDASSTTVVTVLQPGYRAGEQVLRPARVAVADRD
ncbi:nucleotide exchange factor GrpE [Oryzobacter telluris]|uniref:nucleotide exchange factor GrpE n=1 Tax=Oryzobacter telluris TaxID=3149179 RepID=UPI00370DC41B